MKEWMTPSFWFAPTPDLYFIMYTIFAVQIGVAAFPALKYLA